MSEDQGSRDEPATVAKRRSALGSRGPGTATGAEGPSTSRRAVSLDPAALGELGLAERYRLRRLIGRGGMGEVHLAQDARVGRSVALKVMRPEDASYPEAKARFLREARVQGQLEHPSIVPVYDLDHDDKGEVFFVMRRVAGVTLDQVIKGLRKDDPLMVERFSMRRLLS